MLDLAGKTIETKRFAISREAYLQAVWSRGAWRWVVLVGLVFVVVLFVSMALWGMGGMFASEAVWFILLPALLAIQYGRVRRSVYDKANASLFDDPRTMTFSPSGIATRTESGIESRVPWSGIIKCERRGWFTLLFATRLQHLVVPDSAFESPDDREAFEELLRAHRLVGYFNE